jgi:circadian clock protein KaiC
MHLVQIHKSVAEFEPAAVVVDPVSNFIDNSSAIEAHAMLMRLVDFLKGKQITALLTHLTSGGRTTEATEIGISSIIDTWILVRDFETGDERSRGLYVLKSRGMPHSKQIREFLITARGVQLKTMKDRKK